MNIYLHELKANRKFIFTWLISILILVLIMFSMYPSFSQDLDTFKQVLSNYPENLRKAFGINIDGFGSILGYYSSFILTIILICNAMQAMILGISILSKEIREKTADFLYSKPVSRSEIITAKLLSSFTLFIISNILYTISLYFIITGISNETFNFNTFTLFALIPFFIQLIFFSLGICISAMMSKIKAVLPISMGIVFGIYILGTFADEKYRAIMPFKYFDMNYILNNSKYESNYIILTFGIILVSTILTYIIYKRKDIHSV